MSAGEYENYTVTSQNYDSSKQKKVPISIKMAHPLPIPQPDT